MAEETEQKKHETPAHAVVVSAAPKKRSARPFVLGALALAVLYFGGRWGYGKYTYAQTHEDTDDAQVDAQINPVLPRTSGYITGIFVVENQRINAGDLVVTLDSSELTVKVKNAEASIRSAQAGIEAVNSNIHVAEVAVHKTETDLKRDAELLKGGAITQQQLDATTAAHDNAVAQFAAAQSQIAVATAQISQKNVDLDFAKLQLSYCRITAPVTGYVSKKSVDVGQLVQAGQPLMAISQNDSIWVTANFKETQIGRVKIGAKVELALDAYPGIMFDGVVQSFSPATGAKFSLLPPDNASGNFVKVTQRVPVKILVTSKVDPSHPLRPGMSVDAGVIVEQSH